MTESTVSRGGRSPFEFVPDPTAIVASANDGERLVRVPIGVSRKQSLFRCFATGLGYPRDSIKNWDAFRDGLLDLSWLDPPPQRILIVHDDLPFVPGQRDLSVYLEILTECGSITSPPAFRIIFPERHARRLR